MFFTILFLATSLCQANAVQSPNFIHSLYIGALGGYGSTTWEGMVPALQNQNSALSMSTPISADEGGGVWGFFTGYEFSDFFAVEVSYINYPNAVITFDTMSLFSFDHNDQTSFSTDTETVNIMGKVMLQVPKTKFRIYSSAGVANVHREDMISNQWHPGPTFGVGINYKFNEHVMAEVNGNYTAGFGESQLNPADTYIPFLYTGNFRLAFFF
ncbi:MAG: hypothetical protein EPN84_03750 [Legionella sp.]|nr:MAG: hypothetical protein EPN84_03750 [Legionella sp.]